MKIRVNVRSRGRACFVLCASALAVGAVMAAGPGARAADAVKASFLTGVWATADGCNLQAAIDAGGPKTVETTPEVLTADGYQDWEGGCSFTSIEESGPDAWIVKTSCSEGAEEWQDTETWALDSVSGRLKVTVDDQVTEFVRCDGGRGN